MEFATKVFVGGTVLTMDGARTVSEAVALIGDRILAVGDQKYIKDFINEDTEVVDLMGATLLPGFYDPHGHLNGFAHTLRLVDLSSPSVGNVKNIDELLEALKQAAKMTPKGKTICGMGYDDTLLADQRHPLRSDLDRVSSDHPIIAVQASGHLSVFNSRALEQAGITKDTPNPDGGIIQKDEATGELNGILEENASFAYSAKLMPPPTADEMIGLLNEAARICASKGVTTIKEDAPFDMQTIDSIYQAATKDEFPVRVSISPHFAVSKELGSLDKLIEYMERITKESDKISFSGIKLMHGGSIQVFTAYLSEPYHTPYLGNDQHRGYPVMEKQNLGEIIEEIHVKGQRVLVHTNGDAAIDDVLDAIEAAQKSTPREDARHLLIHCQTVREDQLDRMQALGVHPNFFVLHIYYWGGRHENIFLGSKRAKRLNPIASAMDKGLVATIHCDIPIVPLTPLLAVQTAVTRKTYQGNTLGPQQRVCIWDALKMYTISAAWQFSEEKNKGSIERGKLADFVILESNPLTCDPDRIKDIKVLETIVAGKTVYLAPQQ